MRQNKAITEFDEMTTPATDDYITTVDTSEPVGSKNRKMTFANLLTWINSVVSGGSISGGVTDNFVGIAADDTLKDSGSKASDFAVAAKGVTNGDSHDHSGGDGAQISHAGLSNLTTGDPHTQYLKMITADTTLYVATTGDDVTGDGSSGTPWATPHKALEYLRGYWISPAATVTIQCADGTYTFTTKIDINHSCGDRIVITGQNTYAKTMSSVQSSSGGAGAWAIIINVNSVANIAVNDFVIISAPSGGTKPTYVAGVHKVTNVDAVNTRITFSSTHQSATAPSAAINATVTVIKTVFKNSTTNIVWLDNGSRLGTIKKCILDGTGSAEIGMYVTGKSLAVIDEGFGIYASDGGLFSDNGSTVWAKALMAISAIPGHCYQADDHSTIICPSAIASGITTAASYSFFATYGSHIECTGAISTGGASTGIIITTGATARAESAVVSAHTISFYAGRYGYIYAVSSSSVDHSSDDYSPNVNTEGNEGGYIDT